jgi:hypothetical protein
MMEINLPYILSCAMLRPCLKGCCSERRNTLRRSVIQYVNALENRMRTYTRSFSNKLQMPAQDQQSGRRHPQEKAAYLQNSSLRLH